MILCDALRSLQRQEEVVDGCERESGEAENSMEQSARTFHLCGVVSCLCSKSTRDVPGGGTLHLVSNEFYSPVPYSYLLISAMELGITSPKTGGVRA